MSRRVRRRQHRSVLLPSDHGDEFQGKTEAPVFAKAGEERWAHPAQLALLRLLPAGFDSRGPYDRLHVTRQSGKDASTNSLKVISG
jgi:hypothetical protein